MKTTAVLFEYLAIGVLTLASLLFLYASFFPESQLLCLLKTWSRIQGGLLLGVLTAAAYSAGVIAESAGRICFEWLLDRKKKQWDYFDRNKERENDPILTQYHECVEKAARHVGSTQRQNPECVRQAIGAMKTLVMKDSPDMYREVEANVNKMRLIRPLFLIEGVLLFVIGWRAAGWGAVVASVSVLVGLWCSICAEERWPRTRKRYLGYLGYIPLVAVVAVLFSCSTVHFEEGFWWCALAIAVHVTGDAISQRFDRYLRAIGRSYDALLLASRDGDRRAGIAPPTG